MDARRARCEPTRSRPSGPGPAGPRSSPRRGTRAGPGWCWREGFEPLAVDAPADRPALAAIDEPYRDADPHGVGEWCSLRRPGRPAGLDDDPDWFATRAVRDAALAQRRAEIVSLDGGGRMVSDER